jgi:diguanylate cyclase (GGDEF)-like protein
VRRSLHARLVLLAVVGVGLGAVAAGLMLLLAGMPSGNEVLLRVLGGIVLAGMVGVGFWGICALRILQPLYHINDQFESFKHVLATRTKTVDRLLDFSQTIQGAGKAEQIFQSLCHFLRTELGLAGLTIIARDPEAITAVQTKAAWPEDLHKPDVPVAEMDTDLCPCMRQNLPRQFRADGSPVRCVVETAINLPSTHAAYCIPFSAGRKTQCVAHMILPLNQTWNEQRQQLAQMYVNTACSSLMSLHLLEDAEQRSMTDPLTQLYNRRSMEQLMQREVALSERHGHPLSLVMIDMDKFKEINDAHGHAAGDYLLKTFADCVRITLRKTDLAFRYGGDEFVIALPQTPLAQAQQVVQKVRQAFAAVDFSSAIARLGGQPTLSVGVAERSKSGNVLTLEQMLAAVDEALYDAKNSARNCVRVYQPQRAA